MNDIYTYPLYLKNKPQLIDKETQFLLTQIAKQPAEYPPELLNARRQKFVEQIKNEQDALGRHPVLADMT